jgi:hypothetical protein
MDTVENLLRESYLTQEGGINRSLNIVIFKHLYNTSIKLKKLEVGKEYTIVYLIAEEAKSRINTKDSRKLGNFYFYDNVIFKEKDKDLFYFDRITSEGSPYRHYANEFKYQSGWWIIPIDD